MRPPRIQSLASALLIAVVLGAPRGAEPASAPAPQFQTSDRCFACHNGLTTASGEDVSIGLDWRASIMANSARDPYWQASVRRETLDHPESQAKIEDECASCHMPMARYHSKSRGQLGQVFAHLAAPHDSSERQMALDGVSCSLCHQMSAEKLGQPQTLSGEFIIATPPDADHRFEFGPFDIDAGLQRVMRSSSGGFEPTRADHIRQSEVCASCHTLHTSALGANGAAVGSLPEQTPYQEWLHSSYVQERSCQACHMPAIAEPIAVSSVLGEVRAGAARHVFVAANFFMQRMLGRYRDDLDVAALPDELSAAADRTVRYLQANAATVTVERAATRPSRLEMDVRVKNLGGHRLPTAYPSRRAWLHIVVTDANGRTVFESGALNLDGSIQGNDNDADALRVEPHYRTIRSPDQVQIYESILRDPAGGVTTGLLSAVGYLKDNRLLPRGFDKATAPREIAVHGDAVDDDAFTDAGHRLTYAIDTRDLRAPFEALIELRYQPIGYRWAHNLAPYDAPEPRRFVRYFESMQSESAVTLASTRAIVSAAGTYTSCR